MIYLITYDKNNLFKNYEPLYEAIKTAGSSWWHHMNNTWLINTNLNASQIYNRLKNHINTNDRLLIVQISPYSDYQGWLNKQAWEWIKQQRLL